MTPEGKKRTILLVDDVELFLELEKTFFHREDFDLLMAINAQEIMQLVLERKPDLIFLDMLISGASGDKVCSWIKKDPELQMIPVIMLIEAGEVDSESRCRLAGCDALIHTPVRRNQLLSVTRQMLDLQDRQQARVAKRVLVHFGPNSQRLSSHFTVNLSPDGMFLATNEVYPIGTPLALRVQIPGSTTLSCQGQVAWLNDPQQFKKPHLPNGMGIRFSDLAELHREQVKNFLNQRAA